MNEEVREFSGVGTILQSRLLNVVSLADQMEPEALIKVLTRYLSEVRTIVAEHSGMVIRYEGDFVEAIWHPDNAQHAERAFDAACAIAKFVQKPFIAGVCLGTGALAGNLYGPKKQFMVSGVAVAMVKRLTESTHGERNSVRITQFTKNCLKQCPEFQSDGIINRAGLESLEVYACFPSN